MRIDRPSIPDRLAGGDHHAVSISLSHDPVCDGPNSAWKRSSDRGRIATRPWVAKQVSEGDGQC
jgi:hypothetical protein